MPNPSFVASPTTRLLRQALAKVSVGTTVTYADLGREIAEAVDGAHPALQSARNSLLRSDRIVFSNIRGVGLKRLTDAEIVAAADQDVDAVRRKARKGAIKVTAVRDFGALSPGQQLAHTTRLSILTAVAAMASDKGIRKVEAAASGRSTELPIAETLRALGAGGAVP